MRVVAILATYNEERFVAACLENLFRQGVEVYLCDNASTDQTVAIAESYRDRGLVGFQAIPRAGVFDLRQQLQRKEELAATIDADWFMHVDADEIHLPPRSDTTLAAAFTDADAAGYNTINFMEYTFVPTKESPDHDRPDFQETMRWYYPFLPSFPHALRAWKRQPAVELAWAGGHLVRFPGQRTAPQSFRMKHYLFLSKAQVIRKYVDRRFDPDELKNGWHGWRAKLQADMIDLPPHAELRRYQSDDELDPSNPRTRHVLDEMLAKAQAPGK